VPPPKVPGVRYSASGRRMVKRRKVRYMTILVPATSSGSGSATA
jgi:hypothetical protein